MSADRPRPSSAAVVAIVLGWLVMAAAAAGVLADASRTHPPAWTGWLVGAAVAHDALWLPAVLAAGLVLGRVVPTPWRVPALGALAVGSVVTLVSWPAAVRYGADPRNPTLLPLPVGRNLVVLWSALVVGAVAAGALRARRHRRGSAAADLEPPLEAAPGGPPPEGASR